MYFFTFMPCVICLFFDHWGPQKLSYLDIQLENKLYSFTAKRPVSDGVNGIYVLRVNLILASRNINGLNTINLFVYIGELLYNLIRISVRTVCGKYYFPSCYWRQRTFFNIPRSRILPGSSREPKTLSSQRLKICFA